MIDTDYLYEFCLDWQMQVVDREELKKDFAEHGWDFQQFKQEAMKYKWFVTSMEELSK